MTHRIETAASGEEGTPVRQMFAITGGHVRRGHSLHSHPADGTVARVNDHDDDWHMSFPDPTADTHMEWTMRYGNPESIRFTVASVLSSYDYLLSGNISQTEAIRRLRLLRAGYAELCKAGQLPPRGSA